MAKQSSGIGKPRTREMQKPNTILPIVITMGKEWKQTKLKR
jgi:hypothetical protein